jgi:hypothetical protein
LCGTEARRRRVGVAQIFSRKLCVTTYAYRDERLLGRIQRNYL